MGAAGNYSCNSSQLWHEVCVLPRVQPLNGELGREIGEKKKGRDRGRRKDELDEKKKKREENEIE
jgi:hypothetical protein